MTARESMSLPTEFAVCEALTNLAVLGSDRSAEAAIGALYELGYDTVAAALDEALALRRELSTDVGDHSVKASPLVDNVIAYVGVHENGRRPRS